MIDDPANTEYQSLLEAESLLDHIKIEIRADAAAMERMSPRDAENYARHDASNYHACLEHVRARASSVRTIETAALILRSRIGRAIRALVSGLS